MRILLIGEFSRLHNSLKEGLIELGHEVYIVGNGDGFKNYPVDYSTKAFWCETKIGTFIRKSIHKIFKIDIIKIEFGIRFYFHLDKLKNFDIVQLINEAPIQTLPFLERFLLKKIFKNNKKIVLLCCGVDYLVAQHLIEKKERYSIMNPYFEKSKNIKEYQFILDYLKPSSKKTHDFVYENINGVIASDIDYVNPIKNQSNYLGLIPNPINTSKIDFIENKINDTISIFLGINKGTYHSKGIAFFEKTLEVLKQKYPDKIEIIVAKNLPYNEYISLYNKAHIVLDQVYAFDQGYNALEAMAKGKVVFTGAEKEFEAYYNLSEKVAVNALPNVDYLVAELSFLIENPDEIIAIGKRTRTFIEKEHDYLKVSKKYLMTWAI
ncbi:glycosyltransferase [Flavobacterium sp.]|uniref:glycosyltransferase n=1 Tax=Flavobacterium sp. TaxID=239 RepID=UPI002636A6FF|nr:glycosyltransferase [Flavobacterium sp.]